MRVEKGASLTPDVQCRPGSLVHDEIITVSSQPDTRRGD